LAATAKVAPLGAGLFGAENLLGRHANVAGIGRKRK
jgi:hypothetical protein